MQQSNDKVVLFEQTPIPKAVAQLAVPTVLSSLVMVLYNLADTFWVGMLNDPIQNAAVTLAAPVLLAFNAVNNLFGVGSSSMMSRALGRKDFDTVSAAPPSVFTARSSAAPSFLCYALFSSSRCLCCWARTLPRWRQPAPICSGRSAAAQFLPSSTWSWHIWSARRALRCTQASAQ